jgi:hypothetical protein
MTPLTGDKLHAARKAAAQRFTAIAMMYVPEGWKVETRKCRGYCKYDSKTIVAPKPVTRKSLHLFLHECAHAHLHAPIYFESKSKYKSKPKHVVEMEAEKWADQKMREHGVPVPRATTKLGKEYVARKIKQAEARGARRIDPEARRFAKGSAA